MMNALLSCILLREIRKEEKAWVIVSKEENVEVERDGEEMQAWKSGRACNADTYTFQVSGGLW